MEKVSDVSFCRGCGEYLVPDGGSIRQDDQGNPVVLCDECEMIQDGESSKIDEFNSC
jgi:hypothetical protein